MHQKIAQISTSTQTGLVSALTTFATQIEAESTQGPTGTLFKLRSGSITLRERSLLLEAADNRALFLLQQLVIRQAEALELERGLEWDHIDVGALPPNFSCAQVVECRAISPNFRRVRLQLEDIARFADHALHFRLVISALSPGVAQGGSIPAYPKIHDNGAVEWPKGDLALHRPVYTLTEVDVAAGWLEFDVFVHEGGRVSAWAERARPGDAVGVLGPTQLRRDLPAEVCFLGDETALPAIRLYLASLAPQTRGAAVITLQDRTDAQELPRPAGVVLRYVPQSPGALLHALQAERPAGTDFFLYAGAERAEVDLLRAHAKDELGLAKTQMNLTAFWSR